MLITQQPCLTRWPMRGYVTTSPSQVHSLQTLATSRRGTHDPSSVSSGLCLSLADKSCLSKRDWSNHVVPSMPAQAVATVRGGLHPGTARLWWPWPCPFLFLTLALFSHVSSSVLGKGAP